jgi:hypothetical protein
MGVDASEKGSGMNICKTCVHWGSKRPEDDYLSNPVDPDTYEPMEMPFEVKRCCHPKLHRFERPSEPNGFAVNDGSDYYAALHTAEQFGCVLWEPKT